MHCSSRMAWLASACVSYLAAVHAAAWADAQTTQVPVLEVIVVDMKRPQAEHAYDNTAVSAGVHNAGTVNVTRHHQGLPAAMAFVETIYGWCTVSVNQQSSLNVREWGASRPHHVYITSADVARPDESKIIRVKHKYPTCWTQKPSPSVFGNTVGVLCTLLVRCCLHVRRKRM